MDSDNENEPPDDPDTCAPDEATREELLRELSRPVVADEAATQADSDETEGPVVPSFTRVWKGMYTSPLERYTNNLDTSFGLRAKLALDSPANRIGRLTSTGQFGNSVLAALGTNYTSPLERYTKNLDTSFGLRAKLALDSPANRIGRLTSTGQFGNSVLAALSTNYTSPWAHLVKDPFAHQREQMLKLTRGLSDRVRFIWPPNLRDIEGLTLESVEAVVMDDGIPLYAVPRRSTAQAILEAGSFAARRDIIGSRWHSITTDCERALNALQSPSLVEDTEFALLAVAALRDGHSAAAQALTANLLDSIVRRHFPADRVIMMPSKSVRTPDGYQDFITRKYLATAPVWRAFQSYWPSRGDGVPQSFSRHASAHSVTRRQFSKRNAVQSLMLVTGLLTFLDWHGVARPSG